MEPWQENIINLAGEMSVISRLKTCYITHHLLNKNEVFHRQLKLYGIQAKNLISKIKNINIFYNHSNINTKQIIICLDYILSISSHSNIDGCDVEILTIDEGLLERFGL